MKGIEGVKIITRNDHQKTANPAPQTDQKKEPEDAENINEHHYDPVRTFLDKIKCSNIKKIPIEGLKGGMEIIVVGVTKSRQDVEPDGERNRDPEERQSDRRPFSEEQSVPQFYHG